jgi:hypothetical protein
LREIRGRSPSRAPSAHVRKYRALTWSHRANSVDGRVSDDPAHDPDADLERAIRSKDWSREDDRPTNALLAGVVLLGLLAVFGLVLGGIYLAERRNARVSHAKADQRVRDSDSYPSYDPPTNDPPFPLPGTAGHLPSPPPSVPAAVGNAEQVVAALRPGFRSCYNQGLQTDRAMAGKLLIRTKVAPNGDVSAADVTQNAGLSPAVVACILQKVKGAKFDSPGANGSTVMIPVSFVQQGT